MTTIELPESLPSFSEQETALLELLGQVKPIWTPLPGPQTEAWLTDADELFYGGGAGGGKSDLLIGLSITAHHRSRLFRRETTQMLGIIDRSREIIGARGAFRGSSPLIWRLNDGRVIELAGVKDEDDKRRFQGRPADLIGFDEITEFMSSQYRFLIGWNRSTRPRQRCRVVATGNPPTSAEGEWVIQYWAPWLDAHHPHPAEPGELRWFAVIDGKDVELESSAPFDHKGETVLPRSRTFIPARLHDNPFLMDSGYASVLQGMPEPLRSQMLYGDFEAGTQDEPWQTIPTAWIRAAQARWTADAKPARQTAIGVDVARGGADKTVLAPRYGVWFGPLQKYPGTETPDGPMVAGLVAKELTHGGYANIDVIGVGASVYDVCRMHRLDARPINFAAGSDAYDKSGRLQFVNVRAAAYWAMREALDPDSGDGLMLPPDPELLADLTAPKWSMRTSGIQIESKEDIIKRIGRSPDSGDAVVLANYTGAAMPFGWLMNAAPAA